MEEELAVAARRVVPAARALPGCDVNADQPGFTALDPRVRLLEVDLARADALDLGAGQHDARLEGVLDRVLMTGFAVDGDGFAHGQGSWELDARGWADWHA